MERPELHDGGAPERERVDRVEQREQRGQREAVGLGAAEVADRVQLAGQDAAGHHADAEPEAEQGDLRVVGQVQHLEAPGLEINLHRGAADPEDGRAEEHAAQPRRREQVAQVVAEGRDAGREPDGGLGRRGGHEKIQEQRRAEDAAEHAVGDEHAVLEHIGQHRAGDGAAEDGAEGEQLDHAVGLHEALARQDFGEDAVFGRAVETRADADDEIAEALPGRAEPHAEGADAGPEELQGIAADEPGGLRIAVIEIAGQRREQHVGHKEQAGVDRVARAQLGGGDGAGLLQVGELADDDGENGVVAECAEELAGQQERVVAVGLHQGAARGNSGRKTEARKQRTEGGGKTTYRRVGWIRRGWGHLLQEGLYAPMVC